MKEYHGSAMLGLTSGSLNLEGPLVKDRTSFNFALRRSWIDALSAPTIAIWNATRNKGETQIVARYALNSTTSSMTAAADMPVFTGETIF